MLLNFFQPIITQNADRKEMKISSEVDEVKGLETPDSTKFTQSKYQNSNLTILCC